MTNSFLRHVLGVVAAACVLASCGGSDGGTPAAEATPATGAATYATLLSQLSTPAGLASAQAATVFHEDYMDSGMGRAQVIDALSQERSALAGTADHSLFPQASLTDVQVGGCDANNVCTMTGTLVNADADATSVSFSTKVVNTNGTYRLLGDQLRG